VCEAYNAIAGASRVPGDNAGGSTAEKVLFFFLGLAQGHTGYRGVCKGPRWVWLADVLQLLSCLAIVVCSWSVPCSPSQVPASALDPFIKDWVKQRFVRVLKNNPSHLLRFESEEHLVDRST